MYVVSLCVYSVQLFDNVNYAMHAGVGAYAQFHSGTPHVLLNNGLVTPGTTWPYNNRLQILCVSNSTMRSESDLGDVIGLDGLPIALRTDNGQIRVGLTGMQLRIQNPSWLPPIDSSRQGVYTYQVFDANNVMQLFNIGIYPNGFNSELCM